MRIHLHWDNPEQTIVRWEFEGWIGVLDYMIGINDTASMGIQNGGKADTILNLNLKLPLPNRHPRELIKPVLAARSYGLGYVVVVTRNPIAIAIIRATFRADRNTGSQVQHGLYVAGSLDAARQLITQLRADPTQDIQMKM
ncbi:MAG: hypothetical protein H7Y11_15880 [Armatimonadetes bacterium]|nr:hypothetical protein [Anaerolineae bacterium]